MKLTQTLTPFPELEQAEQLLLHPTAENLDRVTQLFNSLVANLAERLPASDRPIEQSRLTRLGLLLQGALQLRLGLARTSAAGLSGYSPDGRTNDSESFGYSPPLAMI